MKDTSNESQMLELVMRALLDEERATAAVVVDVESYVHEHTKIYASGEARSSNSRATVV